MGAPIGYDQPLSRSQVIGLVGLPAVAILVGGGGAALSDALHVAPLAVPAIAGGLAVLVCAILHPWPFWNHAAALTVRSILGDRGASVFYVVVGLGLASWGVLGIRDWSRNAASCRALFESAHTPQERVRALQEVPPGASRNTCATYREFGKF